MMHRWILIFSTLLAGCGAHSQIVQVGPDTYMLSKQSGNAFKGAGNLKYEVIEEANTYCMTGNKKIRVVSTNEAKPPYILGNYPRAEVQFMCLSGNDGELTRPKSINSPDAIIEIRGK
jgi:hypothetical protein